MKKKSIQGYLCQLVVQAFLGIILGGGIIIPKIRDCYVNGDLKVLLHLQRLEDTGETWELFLGVVPEMSCGSIP